MNISREIAGKIGAGSRRIFITGFDSFLLNSIKFSGFNIKQPNPSSYIALWLAGNDREMQYCKVQTMIVPVRYTDFDNSENPRKRNWRWNY